MCDPFPPRRETPMRTHFPLFAVLGMSAGSLAAQAAYQTLPVSADATTNADQPTVNYGLTPDLDFGKDFASSPTFRVWFTRGHVQFDLSSLQNLPRPMRARFWWNQDQARTIPAGCLAVAVHRVTSPWSETTVTWATNPTFDAAVVAREDVGGWNCSGWHAFDVTAMVNGWLDGVYPNLGMVIRDDGESSAGAARPGKGTSREAANAALRPYLELSWGLAYGAGCPAGTPAPTLELSSGAPQLSGSFTMTSSSLGASVPSILHLGISRTAWGALTLPFPLASIGIPGGCSLLASGNVALAAATNSSGMRVDTFPVPNLPTLRGLQLYLQTIALAGPGLATTNGFAVRLY